MLGFIVPVKPKEYSKNWDLDNLLLERTIRSICNQENDDFKLIVVYTDKPEINFSHKNLVLLKFPYPEIKIDGITDFNGLKRWYTPVFAERMMDKGRKIIFGCQKAKNLNCTYLMGVDSDDLVSSRLASFVKKNCEEGYAGWRIVNGYVYQESSLIAVKHYYIWGLNGSTHIIRSDLVEIPDFETDFNLFHYSLFQSHGYTYQRLIDFKKEILQPLPFYGVIYLVHRNNYSNIREKVTANYIKLIANYKREIINSQISK
jgi:hypothetical protein